MHAAKHRQRRRLGGLIAAAAVLLGGGAVTLAVAAPASAASISHGPGYSYHGHWFGAYRQSVGGHVVNVFCKSPNKALDRPQAFSTYTNVPGVNSATSWRIKYILGTYGNTTSKRVAAGEYSALNYLALSHSSTAFKKYFYPWYKGSSSANKKETNAILAASAKYHGPYHVSLKLSSHPLPGQTATATVTVSPVIPGKVVHFYHSGATGTFSMRTNSHGQASARFTRPGAASVHIAARVFNLSGNKVRVSHPGSGQQSLLTNGTNENLYASVGYSSSVSGSIKYSCTTTCNGHPPVTASVCHYGYEDTRQYVLYDNTTHQWLASRTAKRSSKGACFSFAGTGTDTHSVTMLCRYTYTNGKYSGWYSCGPTVKIDCPPWPVISEHLSCGCTAGELDLSLPANSTAHAKEILYSVNGGAWQHKLQSGHNGATSVTVPFDRSKTSVDVKFYGAVQRTNHSWNGGGLQEVIVSKI